MKCKVQDCSNQSVSKGFCIKHYHRYRRHGDPLIVWPNKRNFGKCIVQGCDSEQRVKHLCIKHYHRFLKWGSPDIIHRFRPIGAKNVNWRGGVAEYPNHYRMKKLRLIKLKEKNFVCELCGGKAREVHLINYDKADHRLENYLVLCHKCHFRNFHSGPHRSKYSEFYGTSLREFCRRERLPYKKICYKLYKKCPIFVKFRR